ncbi:polyamine aminopropyltransferase [Flammeovirgaceae bacterium SG7u.111]|nr:polyamine aminopropyltransferase [Flammeovirgaceae bacterium SG7u.132]WPO37396.1 polyamine aminopropyltransferase [Flammeovirgaceae bacterium SG7u.111]
MNKQANTTEQLKSLGKHIIAEYFGCEKTLLNDVVFIEKSMIEAAKKANATIINSTFHHFSPYGVSGVVVIQESHLAIHTWPEYGFASVDIFTCGEDIDPWVSSEYLSEALQADHYSPIEMLRGQKHLLPQPALPEGLDSYEKAEHEGRELWFTERTKNMALSVRHSGELLFRTQSEFQKIEVYQTELFGKMLVLDGVIATTEKDEAAYHEMLAHVPLLSHSTPQNILVVGGGDGGIVKQVLMHPEVENVTVLEQDEEIVAVSKRFFPSIAAQGLENKKTSLVLMDAFKFFKKVQKESLDIILVDTADAVGIGEGINGGELFSLAYEALKQDGILVTQAGSPNLNDYQFKEVFQSLKQQFGKENVRCYLTSIPTYPSGMWGLALCKKGSPTIQIDSKKQKNLVENHRLAYYNPELHQASFALPNYLKEMLG